MKWLVKSKKAPAAIIKWLQGNFEPETARDIYKAMLEVAKAKSEEKASATSQSLQQSVETVSAAVTMWKTKKSAFTDANSAKPTQISDLNGSFWGKVSETLADKQGEGGKRSFLLLSSYAFWYQFVNLFQC